MPKGYRKDGTKLGFQKGHKVKLGMKDSDETRLKKSEARKGDKNPHYGVPCYWKDKGLPEYAKKKISYKLKGKPKSLEARKHMSEAAKKRANTKEGKEHQRRAGMKAKSAYINTYPEVQVQNMLKQLGINFKTHFRIENIGVPDILIENKNLIIQVDGDYWHSLDSVKERDRKQDILYRELGYNILRLPEKIIRKEPEKCITLLCNFIFDEHIIRRGNII
jgi:very-short-patch-repair endonuclease